MILYVLSTSKWKGSERNFLNEKPSFSLFRCGSVLLVATLRGENDATRLHTAVEQIVFERANPSRLKFPFALLTIFAMYSCDVN